MPIEAALIKPVVDALMGLFRRGENLHLKHNAEAALREAIRELVLAEDMLRKHRATKARTAGKSGSSRARKTAAKADTKPADKPASKTAKPAAKKPTKK